MGGVIALALALLAVALAWVAPALMARQTRFRRAPRAALFAWQAVTVGAILAALAVAPAAVPTLLDGDDPRRHLWAVLVAAAVSGLLLARLLVSGHVVGTRLRAMRADHRDLVDIIAAHADAEPSRDRVRVLQHPTPTAYCIPGRQARVVLSQGVLDALPPEQLDAVLAHEDLLVEALADRAAVRRSGEVATARALLTIAESRAPEAALGAGTTAPVRLHLLAAGPQPALAAVAYVYAVGTCAVPLALLLVAWR